jgi:hypothetical protein
MLHESKVQSSMTRAFRCFRQCAATAVLAGAFSIPAAIAQMAPVDAADAVFVGHSLTNDEMTQMVAELAASKGMRFSQATQSIPGSSLSNSWSMCRADAFVGEFRPSNFACDAIDAGTAYGPYSVLIATDASNPIEYNRIYNHTEVYFERFMELMLSRNPAARNFLYTSWESLGYAGHNADWTIEVISELATYELIAADAEEISRQRGRNGVVHILPVNLALRRLILLIEGGSVPELTNREDIFADGIHPNAIGHYFVACVAYSAIFNQSPEGAATTLRKQDGTPAVSLSNGLALALQRAAWQTVADYNANARR